MGRTKKTYKLTAELNFLNKYVCIHSQIPKDPEEHEVKWIIMKQHASTLESKISLYILVLLKNKEEVISYGTNNLLYNTDSSTKKHHNISP